MPDSPDSPEEIESRPSRGAPDSSDAPGPSSEHPGQGVAGPGDRLERALARLLPPLALIAFIAILNFRFILRDDSDGALSDANGYTERALQIAHNLRDGPDWPDFRTGPHIYSPLNWVLGGIFAFLTEQSPKALRLFSSLYLPAALVYLYLFARLFLGRWAALLAVFLGGSNGAVLHYSRYFLQDTPLYLALTAALYHLARSRWLRNPPHTMATLAFIGFGAAMKPQFAVMVAPAVVLTGLMGWITRAHRGRLVPLTLLWQVGLLVAFVWAGRRLRPDLFDLLPRAGTAIRQSTYSFSIAVPQNAEGGGAVRGTLYWSMGLIFLVRYLAAPLAALALAGTAWGWWRLRARGLGTAFLGIPLVFIATNLLIVWSGAHEEFRRYSAPILLLYGVPVAALAELTSPRRLRLALLAGVSVLAVAGWAGPRVSPGVFDCQPKCFFPQWRVEGRATRDYPLFVYKAWDEPVARPSQSGRDGEALMEALRAIPVSDSDIGRRLRVACVCSDWPTDASFYWLQGLSSERFEFVRARSLRDALASDALLVIWPSVSGMPAHEYRALTASLRHARLRSRLGMDELGPIGLEGGEILRLYRHRRPAAFGESLERAVAWFETLAAPGTWEAAAGAVASAFGDSGYGDAAVAFRRVAGIDATGTEDELQGLKSAGPATRRLVEWRGQMARPAGEPGRGEAIQQALLNGPEAGPGMMLLSAGACFEGGDKERAAALIRAGIDRYPDHQETWSSARRLVSDGLPFHEGLAVMGERLAINHPLTFRLEHYQNVVDSFRLSRRINEIANAPNLLKSRNERLELLERDHPEALPTLLARIASLDSENSTSPELESALRNAISLNETELVDYDLYNALGLLYMKRGEPAPAGRAMRRGGWQGYETLLVYLSAIESQEGWQKELKRSLRVRCPLELRGSDAARKVAAIGLAGSDPRLAHRAFSSMNASEMAEELPIFSQLASATDDGGLHAFEGDLQKARVGYYDGGRADAYLALLEMERRERRGEASPTSLEGLDPGRADFIRKLAEVRQRANSLDSITTTSINARRIHGDGLLWRPDPAQKLTPSESGTQWLAELDFDHPTTRTLYLKARVDAPHGRGLHRRITVEGLLGDGQWKPIVTCPLLDGVSTTLEVEALARPMTPVWGFRAIGRVAVASSPLSGPEVEIDDAGEIVKQAEPFDNSPVTFREVTLTMMPAKAPHQANRGAEESETVLSEGG